MIRNDCDRAVLFDPQYHKFVLIDIWKLDDATGSIQDMELAAEERSVRRYLSMVVEDSDPFYIFCLVEIGKLCVVLRGERSYVIAPCYMIG
jgi:hypothetical protein